MPNDPSDNRWKNYKATYPPQIITTSNGGPIYSKPAVLTAGRRGPIIMQDVIYMDEMAHFDRERIPEKVVHAKGAGAHGYFEVSHDISKYCKADIFIKPVQGIKNLTVKQSGRLASEDPDYSIRDLFNAIEKRDFPVWKMFIQIMTFEQAEKWELNPFDLTKVWPHGDYPLIEVGKMVLNRNPRNYFAEENRTIRRIEQPAHIFPGIEFSPDKMLQGRIFSYTDTHFHLLGPNYIQLPVNCPYRSRAHNTQRDDVKDTVFQITGDVDRYESGEDNNYEQPRQFREEVLYTGARERMCQNFAGALGGCHDFIVNGMLDHFSKIHPDFGARVKAVIQGKTRFHI